jgi:hypothetical protein
MTSLFSDRPGATDSDAAHSADFKIRGGPILIIN